MYTKTDILKSEDLKKMHDGDRVKGLVLVKDHTKRQAKNGASYIEGTLDSVGTVLFKVWGNSKAYAAMDGADLSGSICSVSCRANYYNGAFSLILDEVTPVDTSDLAVTAEDFMHTIYNGDEYFAAVMRDIQKYTDEDTCKIFELLVSPAEVQERFKLEYAAKGHHDNCKSGLIAHTYKVMLLARTVMRMYPQIMKFEGTADLVYLGCAIHDIGKIMEYKNGGSSANGQLVSHHTFGVELLFGHKDEIVALKGEEFFYRLCAVIEQHHGEYAERPRTIEAYIVHKIDCLEAELQFLNQQLEGFERGNALNIDGYKLS